MTSISPPYGARTAPMTTHSDHTCDAQFFLHSPCGHPRTPVTYCPFPPGGGRLGWGAEAGTDSEPRTRPHPHAYPPPSRGRECARTGSPIDYLTDVLGMVGQYTRILTRGK